MSDNGTAQVGNWGRWGADDERGTLNLITPEAVRAAAHEIRTGRAFPLGLPIQRSGAPILDYRGAPQRLTLSSQTDNMFDYFPGGTEVGANEDVLIIPSHNQTHMDALSHVQHLGKFYNGFEAGTFRSHTGAERCGIEKIGAFSARAVLFDLVRHFGVDHLEPGYTVTSADLQACADAQGIEVRTGDVMLVRTGFLELHRSIEEQGGEQPFAQAGLGLDAAEYVRAHDFSAIGADNGAVEVIPFDNDVFLSVHIELLVKLGIPMLEHLWLADLAAAMTEAGTQACLLNVSPLPVTGATGSPINPVAIV